MQFEILENGNMRLFIDAEDQELLRTLNDEDPDHFQTDNFMYDWFEAFVCNSDFSWVRPEQVGALTDAPMLGLYGEEREIRKDEDPEYLCVVGHWDDVTWVQDIVEAWAFMDYQFTSPQDVLLENGEVIFLHG